MVQGKLTSDVDMDKDILFTSDRFRLAKKNILAADAIYQGSNVEENVVMIRIINPMVKNNILYKGTKLGRMTEVTMNETVNMLDNKECMESDDVIKQILLRHESHLSKVEMRELQLILHDFKNIFSRSATDVGLIKGYKHDINTGNTPPIASNPRRVPMHMEGKVDKLIGDLEEKGIIKKTSSPWNFPIVVVPKKNGQIRMCIDYRKLNAVTDKPVYYIPNTKQLFDCLDGSQYFSSLDLSMGYHQIEMDVNDVDKTAFTTRTGQYAFSRMPFGLNGAPQTFQRVMASILREQNWKYCIIYLDDILIFGKSLQDHNSRLRSVLSCLQKAGVKLSPEKCSFLREETVYLGHVINKYGIKTDPGKVEKIKNWPIPETKKELTTFLGLCGYYRKFIKGYAKIVRPLELLLRDSKTKKLNWCDNHTIAWDTLKGHLTNSPILSFPNSNGTFILDTDASYDTLGAVLSQVQEGEEKVIAYASNALSKAELQYCVTRKELMAVYKYVKQFQHYLMGKKFVIRTDHRALTWMLNWKRPNTSQYCTWIAELELYDFDIQHRKGESHINADAMSRYPRCQQCELKHGNPKGKRNVKIITEAYHIREDNFNDLVDVMIKQINDNGTLQSLPRSKESSIFWKNRKQLQVVNGNTLVIFRKGMNLNVPRKLNRKKIIQTVHSELGHPGIFRTKSVIKSHFYWPGIDLDTALIVGECKLCQGYKHKQRTQLQRCELHANFPNEMVGIDIAGPFKATRQGNRYILGMIDHYSRYPVLVPLKTIDSNSIAEVIFKNWISIFGIPMMLHSDRGSNLNSNQIMRLCEYFGISKTKTTPYNPQSDGIIERLFRTVKPMLSIVSSERHFDWDKSIPIVEMGLRCSRSRVTGFTPNEILFGHNIITSTMVHCHKQQTPQNHQEPTDYVRTLLQKSEEIKEVVRNRRTQTKEQDIQHFEKGNWVLVRKIAARSGKLLYDGPYQVVKRIGYNAYKLQDRQGNKIDRNVRQLKKCTYEKTTTFQKENTSVCSDWDSNKTEASESKLRHAEHVVPEHQSPESRRYPIRKRKLTERYGFT